MKFHFLAVILRYALFLFFVCFSQWGAGSFPAAAEEILPVVINGDEVVYLSEQEKVTATGNVSIEYEDVVLYCEQAVYDVQKNLAQAKGKVRIFRGGEVVLGTEGTYDFAQKIARLNHVRIESEPFYAQGGQAQITTDNTYELFQGYVTTCDKENPHYRITSRKLTVYPGEKVVGRNVFVKVGVIPVFYLPVYSHSLKDNAFPVEISPGKDKEWGPYVLTRWRYHMNKHNNGKIHWDWYEDRGWGKGLTHTFHHDTWGNSLLTVYQIDDKLYNQRHAARFSDLYPERENIDSKYLQEERYKIQLSYRYIPFPNLTCTAEYHKFSDEFFMKDFFFREYEVAPNPESYLLLDYAFSNSSVSLLTKKRVNHYESITEYLPQLEYNFFRQPLADSKFYLESQVVGGNLNSKTARSDEDSDLLRLHGHNQLTYVDSISWLQISPYIAYDTTFYSKTAVEKVNIWRIVPQAGIGLSTKLYKIFDDDFVLFKRKVDKMRHIVTPTVEYAYVHSPTHPRSQLLQLDGIDSLSRSDRVVFTLYNKLQAKNEQEKWDYVYFAPALGYRFNEEGKGSYFDQITADFDVFPLETVSLTSNTIYNIPIRRITEFNCDLYFKDPDPEQSRYSVSLGHRYTRLNSTQGTLQFSYEVTSKVQFRNYLRYEYNTGDFKEQQYALRFDLHCWWMELGLNVDKQRENLDDYGVWILFTLKAFPEKVHFGYDHTYRNIGDRF